MKSLKILRLSLQIMVVIVFQAVKLNSLLIPLLILTGINVCFLLFQILCILTGRETWNDSTAAEITDIMVLSLYLFYVNPVWLFSFLLIHSVYLVFNDGDKSEFLFIFLMITSFMSLCMHYFSVEDIMTILLMIPSYAGFLYFFKVIREKQNKINREHIYLKKLVENKNNLLSTLTHELRTPLAVIKTSNELIIEGRPGPLNETQKTLMTSSLENTIRLTSLVENILSQVKVEFAWFSMKKKLLDIRTLIRKVAIDIKPFLDTRNQTLHYNYPGLLSKNMADSRWLQQVLLNLIHNASKNSPEGSRLEISVKENEQCVVVSVHDRGQGIKNNEISHVFNEFYQSEDPSKNLNDGAGLGLTIVKDIIEKHGGNVYISSLPGRGTTVSFSLPVYKGVFSETFNTGN